MATGTVFVQVQTVATGAGGTTAAFTAVQAAVAKHNAANPKAVPHVAVLHNVLPNNTKGMQYQLALWATVCRVHGVTMVRLGVHGGQVALCGTKAGITAAQGAVMPLANAYATAVAQAYNPATHGARVAFANSYLCGCPAGLQVANKITPTLAYGIGYLYAFATLSGPYYVMGQNAAAGMAAPKAPCTPRAAKAPKGTATQPATGQVAATTATATGQVA